MDTDILPDPEEKFLFNMHNFDDEVIEIDAPEAIEAPPPPPPVFTESELEAAKQQAFNDGHAAGKKEAETSRAQDLASMMQKLAHDLQMLFVAEGERDTTYEREAVALCHALFKHAFPAFQKTHGLDELEDKMREILAAQHGQSSIEIRVADAFAKGVEGFIEKLKSQNSDLRCEVISDDTLESGAFKLGWKNGGAIYNSHDTAQAILANLEEILAGGAVPSHNETSEESNISGDDVPHDVNPDIAPHIDGDIDEKTSPETPDANNNPIVEDSSNDG